MSNTIADQKGVKQKWIPTWVFNVTLKDAIPRFWARQTLTYNAQSYLPIVLEFSPLAIEGSGIYGVDAVIELNLQLNNADSALTSLITPTNWRGGTIQPFFFFKDPDTGTVTESIAYPIFLLDMPTDVWPEVTVTAHNKWNLARKTLPMSSIGPIDRYPFPNSAADRLAAGGGAGADDFSSPFAAIGYDPARGKGNYKTGVTPYTADEYDGTLSKLQTMGLGIRWGGTSTIPKDVTYSPEKDKRLTIKGSTNEAKYGQPVPLAFGIVRAKPTLLDTGSPSTSDWNGARLSHFLLADGVNFAPTIADMGIAIVAYSPNWEPLVYIPNAANGKAFLRIPNAPSSPGRTGAFHIYPGTYGSQKCRTVLSDYRNISATDDLPDPDFNRDLYSGLAYIEVGFPNELAKQTDLTGPEIEVIFAGLKIETLDSGLNSVWKFSQNPVWIYIHILKMLRWSWSDIDKQSAYDASVICDAQLLGNQPRFYCNLLIDKFVKAADVLRGIRNNCRMYTSYTTAGKLALKIENTIAVEGGAAFAIDSTNIVRGQDGTPFVKKFYKSIYQIGNVYSVSFQDAYTGYEVCNFTLKDIDNINAIDEEISASNLAPIVGIPTFDQARRQLRWLRYMNSELNEFYQVTCTMALITAQVGQIGTFTEPRLGLTAQECRIRSMKPGLDDTVELTLQKHADAAYADELGPTLAQRARSDSSYSPRSVASLEVTELFIQDDVNSDLYKRKLKADFVVPPVTYEKGFSSQAKVIGYAATTGGTIPGDQILFVEVCPTIGGIEGIASDPMPIAVPAGTDTNKLILTITLPIEADGHVIRVGLHPGLTYKYPS